MRTLGFLSFVTVFCGYALVSAQENNPSAAIGGESQAERFAKFEKMLTGTTLIGQFTVLGDEKNELRREEYGIASVEKLDEEDFWLFKASIKYGDTNRTVPMPLRVKWAGSTPVITLDNVTIPGLGTFDARVLIHDNQYVGTWRHGEKAGQLFGVIERLPQPDSNSRPANDER
jgi:hypothetical protein